jgi:hypothetical protein
MLLDIVYIFCHSRQEDWELRYSLRSVAKFLPWVRKVWIFGDRPAWLGDDTSAIEHVPHEYLARAWGLKLPVRNNFWLTFLASLIPELSYEYLWFADDYILLEEIASAEIYKIRAFQDLATVKLRGRGVWKDALWRTHDTLVRLGYGSLNFECHAPQPFNKRLIWEAFSTFQDYITEDRFYGLLVHTAVFNYALKQQALPALPPSAKPLAQSRAEPLAVPPMVWIKEEDRYVGFHNKPASRADILAQTRGKTFLNFDDAAFSGEMRAFLAEQFPEPSKFERG